MHMIDEIDYDLTSTHLYDDSDGGIPTEPPSSSPPLPNYVDFVTSYVLKHIMPSETISTSPIGRRLIAECIENDINIVMMESHVVSREIALDALLTKGSAVDAILFLTE